MVKSADEENDLLREREREREREKDLVMVYCPKSDTRHRSSIL